jgi:glycosyltransferase involved in cell wall biosynthesis
LLLVDNASDDRLSNTWDLSWHPRARHIREDNLGLTFARLRGIAQSVGELLVFVDDDNVLAADFLARAAAVHREYPHMGVFGAGRLEPDFEVQPPPDIHLRSQMLALRSVELARWSNNPRDSESIPWGAGLCVTRVVADAYGRFVERTGFIAALDRRGDQLFAGGDDLFSWVAAASNRGFGIFPELRVTHVIDKARLSRSYFLRLIHDHAFSHGVLGYFLSNTRPRRIDVFEYGHLLLHGIRNGLFSMRCRWAAVCGEQRAARFVRERQSHPSEVSEPAAGELD